MNYIGFSESGNKIIIEKSKTIDHDLLQVIIPEVAGRI
jgi:hypothetical protein